MFNIKLAFSSFKIRNLIKVKDSVPRSLRSCVVYKFMCAGCNSVYVKSLLVLQNFSTARKSGNIS